MLHGTEWPEQTFWACAVRLDTGSRVVFGSDTRLVDVGTAVEASCAIPGFFRPVVIDGVRHVDGAVHSPTNADLAAELDLDLVVVLSPMSSSCGDAIRTLDAPTRVRCALRLDAELATLRRAGTPVLVLQPGREELRAMGPLNMDPTRLVPSILQASSSTLQRLEDPALAGQLEILRDVAAQTPSPQDVPFPDDPPLARTG